MNDFVDHPYDHDYDAMDRMRRSALARAEKAETERNEWEARAVRAERALERIEKQGTHRISPPGTTRSKVIRSPAARAARRALAQLNRSQNPDERKEGDAPWQDRLVRTHPAPSNAAPSSEQDEGGAQLEAPRVGRDRPTVSTTDHERARPIGSSGSSKSGTEDR